MKVYDSLSKAIVIGTYAGREVWDQQCRESLAGFTDYPVISINVPWELNVIRWVYENTTLSEFLFLQDTCIVKDTGWIREIFGHPGSVSLYDKPFYMYLGKYTRFDLLLTYLAHGWPEVKNKRQAVDHEGDWTSWYNSSSKNTHYMWPTIEEDIYVERNGRLNKVYDNHCLTKYKGTWNPEMIA